MKKCSCVGRPKCAQGKKEWYKKMMEFKTKRRGILKKPRKELLAKTML
jgi:hypothetical protein